MTFCPSQMDQLQVPCGILGGFMSLVPTGPIKGWTGLHWHLQEFGSISQQKFYNPKDPQGPSNGGVGSCLSQGCIGSQNDGTYLRGQDT